MATAIASTGSSAVAAEQTGADQIATPAFTSDAAKRTVPMRAPVITADEVFVVQVERIDGNGRAAGELKNPLTIVRSVDAEGRLVSGTGLAMPFGQSLETMIIKNPGPDAAMVHLLVEGVLREIIVQPGNGLAFGDPTSRAFAGATHHCVCECDAEIDAKDDWICGTGSSPCDCEAFNGQRCSVNGQSGTIQNCYYEIRFGNTEP